MSIAATPSTSEPSPIAPGSGALRDLLALIASGAAAREREARPPHDVIDLIRETRFGAMRIPVEEGGAGASYREFFAILIELAHADANVAHILRAHFWFVESRLLATDRDERARWLGEVARGAIFGNAASELGSRTVGGRELDTRLSTDGDGFRLNGTKYYCTGSLFSDWVAVFAATDDGRIASVIVPVDRGGFTLEDDWDGIGQRLTGTGTARLVDVAVAADEVILLPGGDEWPASYQGAFLQLYLTAVIAGISRSVVDDAAGVIRARTRTYAHAAAPTATADPQLQQVLGEVASQAFAAEALVLIAAEALDAAAASVVEGVPDVALAAEASLRAAKAKVVVDALAPRIATQLFDAGGASATKQAHNLDRHWRNARTLASHNPTIYKSRAIGDWLVNGTPLPANGFF
ncbi:MAG: acyl-CoA dehydrogenase family protein [Solirubrobacteraceae bacterium]|jgi:alkylation response protein AidB-like acyl-CoA dehydrogenase